MPPGPAQPGLSVLKAVLAVVPSHQAASSPYSCINCHSDGICLKMAVRGGVDGVASHSADASPGVFQTPLSACLHKADVL